MFWLPLLLKLLRDAIALPGHPLRAWVLDLVRARVESPEMTPGFAVFVLITFFGRTGAEAAAATGVALESVPDHLRAGQATLRRLIRNDPFFRMFWDAFNG